jgi:hypothetical protein
MPPSSSCGPHTELVANNAIRVTRCACGTVHVTLIASGVTLRMSLDAFRAASAGMKAATERLDDAPHLGGATIN